MEANQEQIAVQFINCTTIARGQRVKAIITYLRFWNQILIWVSVSFSVWASSALSGPDRYLWWLNRLSSSKTWACEKAARDRFLRGFRDFVLFGDGLRPGRGDRCVSSAKEKCILIPSLTVANYIFVIKRVMTLILSLTSVWLSTHYHYTPRNL